MNSEIFNKIGLFNYNGNKFYGKIIKSNGGFEFMAIDMIFRPDDDYLLINGGIDNIPVAVIIFNWALYSYSGTVHKETYSVNSLFVGKNFKDFDEISFKKISIKINNISSTMMKLSSFDHNFSDKSVKAYCPLTVMPKDDYEVDLDKFLLKIRLNSYYEKRKKLGNGEYANFSEDIVIILEYSNKQRIGQIISDSIIIQNLFTFITGKSRIVGMNCLDDEKEFVEMILPIVSDETISRREYPSAIQLTESNFKIIFKNWFDNYYNFDSFYDLYFSLQNSHLNPATLFLTYARILESYHRQKYFGKYISNEDFKEIRSKVKNFINDLDEIEDLKIDYDKQQFKNKITSSIDHSHEFSLKDRLLELFNELKDYDLFNIIVDKYIDDGDKISRFSNIVRDNRNYYTHYGDKRGKILEGKDLMEFNEMLKFIIDLFFLKEMEFTVKDINNITKNNKNFRFTTYSSWE